MYIQAIATMFRSIMKHLLVMSNSSGSVVGASMMVSGYIVKMVFKEYLSIFNPVFIQNVMKSMMILGGVVLGLTILGSVGAIFEGTFGKVVIILYAILIPIILVMQVYVTVVLYDYRGTRKSKVFRRAASSLSNNDDILIHNVTLDNNKFLPLFPTTLSKSDKVKLIKRGIDSKIDNQHVTPKQRKSPINRDALKSKFEYENIVSILQSFVDSEPESFDGSSSIRRGNSKIKNLVEGRTDVQDKYTSNTMHRGGKGTLRYSWLISTLLGWLLPNKLEPDTNEHVKKLKPLLGALSKPLLFISLDTDIMIAAIITGVVEGFSFFIAIYLAITKNADEEEDEED